MIVMFMTKPDPSRFFDEKVAENYDSHTERMKAVTSNLHLLIELVLREIPDDARILCVGAGTGTEIIQLAVRHPNWQFVALEPSHDMLSKCESKIEKRGLTSRCSCVHGYLSDIGQDEQFDAVLCLLVTQFILDREERQSMFDSMANHLHAGGYLINAEISADMQSAAFDNMIDKWVALQREVGATKEDIEKSISMMRQHVAVVPPSDIENMLKQSGFALPMLFFQSLFIHAWYSQK